MCRALALLLFAAACGRPEGGVKLLYAGNADGTPRVVERRLRALMIRSAHVQVEGANLAVYVPGGRRLDDVKETLKRRGALEMSFVAETGAMPSEDEALDAGVTLQREPVREGVSAYVEGSSREAVEAAAKLLWPTQRVLIAGEGAGFRSWVLDEKPVVTAANLTDASDQFDTEANAPVVDVTFDDAGRAAFAKATAANVGRRLAIIVDGEVKAAPTLMSPIPGGHARITLGKGAQLIEARTLAAALKSGVLPQPLVLESEGAYPPRGW